MEAFGRAISGILFIIFFFIFVLLSTLRFELMNPAFLFFSLQSNHVYDVLPSRMAKAVLKDNHLSQEEKIMYSKAVAAVSPAQMKEMIETNATTVLKFLNGESKDIKVRISASQLSLPGKDLTGSLQALPKERRELAQQTQGVGQTMIVVIIGLLVALVLLQFFAGKGVILVAGIMTIIIALLARVALWVISTNTPQLEPPQLLLVVLASSIFADIVFTWMIFGGLCIALWILLKKRHSTHKAKY